MSSVSPHLLPCTGINIVANFVSPAFDFSNVDPQRITFRMGGMFAACAAVAIRCGGQAVPVKGVYSLPRARKQVVITPWNLYSSPEVIHYTLDSLSCFIGPVFGIMIADFYCVSGKVDIDSLFVMDPDAKYYYQGGYNCAAVMAIIPSVVIPGLLMYADAAPESSAIRVCLHTASRHQVRVP